VPTAGKYTDMDSLIKITVLIILVMLIIFSFNLILSHLIFHFPGRIHWPFLITALLSFYVHFSLICLGKETKDLFFITGRAKLLFPILIYTYILTQFLPKIKQQEWHKHRALIILGPVNLILCLGGIYLLHIPVNFPAVLVSAFSVLAGYYSISTLPLIWIKFTELWQTIELFFQPD